MYKKLIKKIISYTLIFTFLFSSALMPLGEAAPHEGRQHRENPPGMVVDRLPPGYRDVWVGRNRYFHHDGVFYRRGPRGFVVVEPPFGALVFALPIGAAALLIGGITYYLCDGIYYHSVPGGYEVVEPPNKPVEKEVSPVVPSKESIGETVSVTVPLLNVRSGPRSDFPVIFQVHEGESLIVHGYAPDWLYVKSKDNEFGWVMIEYTSPLSQPANG